MDVIVSRIRSGYFSIRALLADIAAASADFNALVARISRPSLPNPNPSVSFWQQEPLFPELVDIQSSILPETADIVIIGSGISGTSIAYTILTEHEALKKTGSATGDLKVVMLEARDVCSGATGRNGGHIKCVPYSDYASFKSRFGVDRAKKLLEFEQMALPVLVDFAEDMNFGEAEVREVETIDIFTDRTAWEKAKNMVWDLRQDVPTAGKNVQIYAPEEGCQKFGIGPDQCYGMIKYQAGALWPYRLVTLTLASLLSAFSSTFSIEANTPVTGVKARDHPGKPFLVCTPRGGITAGHVIHATDAFASNLIPGFIGKLFPLRGHMTAQKPGHEFPDLNGSRSWSILGARGFEYITQRPGRKNDASKGHDGELMVGGGVVQSPGKGIDEFGIWRDDQACGAISAYLDGIMPVTFGKDSWGVDLHGSRVKQSWVGCMGFTPDLLPYVGRLDPGLTGRKIKTPRRKDATPTKQAEFAEWVSAGFGGEGMIQAWLSGVAVGLMVLGREKANLKGRPGIPAGTAMDWLPRELLCTKRRVDRSTVTELSVLL